MKIFSFHRSAAGHTGRAARMLAAILVTLTPVLRSPAAQAPPHNISAANLDVIQNDSGNTEASVTVTAPLSINDLRVRTGSNRGDYNVQVGDTGTNDLAGGFILSAVRQNGRYNLDEGSDLFYGVNAFDGNANGFWVVAQDVTSDRAEYNANCAVAYFNYTNWFMGWARNSSGNNGATNNQFRATPGLLLGNHFKGISGGRSRVDLRSFGIGSTNSGVLLVNHAKNEGNFALSVANDDGTWEIYVKDNFGDTDNPFALEQDPAAFVFIPKTNTIVVSGKFGLDATGTNAVILLHSGSAPAFAVTNFDVGRYRLTIPGQTPASGVLITSCEGGYTNNFDNIVSYEADGDGWIIESRDTGVYSPPLEACTNEPIASFVFIPAATPGFTVTPTNTLYTSEFGLTASFSVVLDSAPTNDVEIAVSSSNPLEGVVSTNLLAFNVTNWNVPQIVTVTGQDDALADGNVVYSIVLAAAVSTDPTYNGLNPADVSVINTDDEQSSIAVTPTTGLVTTEAGSNATFSVFLSRQPTADVVIGLSSSNPAEGTVAPATLTFTPGDWSTPQVVTVAGVDDFKQDADIAYTIVTAPAVSTDLSYDAQNPADVSVVNLNNDTAGYVWTYTVPVTVVEGSLTNYTLALGTQPATNVYITNTTSSASVATVSPGTLIFTPANWNVPQTITVSGGNDLLAGGTVGFTINHRPASPDPVYSQLISTITVPAFRVDNESIFALPSGDCIYGIGMPPIGIDGRASIEDVDTTSFGSGILTVALTVNGTANDLLAIRNAGTAPGQIGVSGGDVSYGGVTIGTFTGGTGPTPLAVTFNANATVPAVQQLIRSVTFVTATNGASLLPRTAAVTLDDGLGYLVTVTKAIRVGALRQTQYQEGADYGYNEYTGAADIALSEVGNSTPWPIGRTPAPTEGLLIDWPDGGTPNASHVLLRFDDFVGTNYWQVPSNAIIVSAELLLRVNNTGDGGRFYRMLVPWDATNDTWVSLGDGIQADDIEASSQYEAQLGVEDGSGATGTGIISVGVTPDVQAWAYGTNNYGWAIIGWPLRTDGTGFSPSEDANVGERPRLRVLWLDPQTVTNVVSFQQGVNGYTNAHDTNLRQANPDLNYGTEITIWSDAPDSGGTNATHCLLRFDDIIGPAPGQVPPGSLIHAAVLEMPSVGPDAMGDGGQFFAMLQSWDDTTATWNSMGAGIQTNGVEAAVTPTVVAGNSTRDPDVQGTINSFEVTMDVQAWVNGTRGNYGWAILPWPSGSNGWGTRSSEYETFAYAQVERERPQLRVYFTPGANAIPAVIQSLTINPTQIQVPFTGTAGFTYTVLRAPMASGPWGSIGTATVGVGGTATFNDNAPLPGGAFYRVVYP